MSEDRAWSRKREAFVGGKYVSTKSCPREIQDFRILSKFWARKRRLSFIRTSFFPVALFLYSRMVRLIGGEREEKRNWATERDREGKYDKLGRHKRVLFFLREMVKTIIVSKEGSTWGDRKNRQKMRWRGWGRIPSGVPMSSSLCRSQ